MSCSGYTAVNDQTPNLCPYTTDTPAGHATPAGTGWCAGPEFNVLHLNLVNFAQQLVHHEEVAVASPPAVLEKVKYWEIWNEPNSGDPTNPSYWDVITDPVTGNYVVDWPSLIIQTKDLEAAIQGQYNTDGISGTPVYVGPAISTLGNL